MGDPATRPSPLGFQGRRDLPACPEQPPPRSPPLPGPSLLIQSLPGEVGQAGPPLPNVSWG